MHWGPGLLQCQAIYAFGYLRRSRWEPLQPSIRLTGRSSTKDTGAAVLHSQLLQDKRKSLPATLESVLLAVAGQFSYSDRHTCMITRSLSILLKLQDVAVKFRMLLVSHCQNFFHGAAEEGPASPHSILGWEINVLWFLGISLNQSQLSKLRTEPRCLC